MKAMKLRFASGLAAIVAAACLAGCASVSTTQGGAVGVARQQRMMSGVSEAEVEAMSAKSYAEQLAALRAKGRLNNDPALTARVRRIASRVIREVGVYRSDATRWKWEVNVADAPELNAYAMAGGKVMVYSGIVRSLSLSDAELAAVLGHEFSHALREHTREGMSQAMAQQLGLGIIGMAAGLDSRQMNMAGKLANVALAMPHSRTMESEADVMGLELMARAGYDPNAAISLWKKMLARGDNGGIEYLSTHPSGTSRIQELSAHLPEVMPLYRNAPKP
ncbi:M48 family metallopeptidase [Paludibacterium paludis]|uniref:Lipoprotein n=1 Tax=Paludibacterium paludis TaxID=1225769 RepID=A0A918P1J6_9NEIS|nr:M48 family metallopeptidase [Paludibacterium paludis]GGY12401.1 lipoprotein [Paludibacterium paludis]